jgi:hypothetical protein
MSRRLVVLLLPMVVLVGAMGLKTAVTAHGDGSFLMANGAAPVPVLSKNGPDPAPTPWRNGPDPAPTPWRNGPDPAPTPWK